MTSIMKGGYAVVPVLFCLLLAACGGSARFRVVGNISNLPPSQIVLLQEIGFDDMIRTIDSAHADDKGHFELTGEGRGPGLYRLFFDKDQQILLSLDKENARLTGDFRQLTKYSVAGSPASESLHSFIETVEDFVRNDQTLTVVQKQLREQGKDSLFAKATEDQAGRTVSFTASVERYADTTIYLPNALYSVHLLNPDVEGSFLGGFAQNLARRFPNAPAAKDFADKYKAYAAKQKGGAEQPDGGALATGAIAPDLALAGPDGNIIKLSSLRGKYVLLDFWASWCQPCRRENPNVVAAFSKFRDKGFTVYGVSLDQKKEDWTAAIAKDGLAWTHVSDLQGWQSVAARDYDISEIPSNFLLDKDGKIIARNLHGGELEAKLAEVLK